MTHHTLFHPLRLTSRLLAIFGFFHLGLNSALKATSTTLSINKGDTLLLHNPTFANEQPYTATNSLGSITSTPSRLAIFTNGYGLGDAWELQYFGNLDQRATGDFDGDPLTHLFLAPIPPPRDPCEGQAES